MNKQIKKFCVKIFVLIFIVSISSNFAFSLIWKNWRECVNDPNCNTESLTPTLKSYVVQSAGYFLNSHSNYQTFLNRVELAEINCIDYVELREILNCTIQNLESAKAAYINFKAAADNLPYNQAVIDKLMKFDYDGFRIKYGLNESIFAQVKALLIKGDIAGLDKAALSNVDIILSKLYSVKAIIDKDQFPDIGLLWRINQLYAEDNLFGQYVSEVLKANIIMEKTDE